MLRFFKKKNTMALRPGRFEDLPHISSWMTLGERKGHFLPAADDEQRNAMLEKAVTQEVVFVPRLNGAVHAGFLMDLQVLQISKSKLSAFVTMKTPEIPATHPFYNCLEIYQFMVNPELQGRGIGGLLLDKILGEYTEHSLFARCLPASQQMIAMLKRRGFKPTRGQNDLVGLILER